MTSRAASAPDVAEDGFSEVVTKKKPRAPRVADVDEDVWAFSTDWDWTDSELRFVKQFRTVREGRRWGETKPYYHLYCPERNKVIGRVDGRIEEFRGSSEYRKMLLNNSTVPEEMLAAWADSRAQSKELKKKKKESKKATNKYESEEDD